MFNRFSVLVLMALSAVITSVTVQAQVILHRDDIPNEAGTLFTFYVDTSSQGLEVDLGEAGANRHWDFLDYIFDTLETDSLLNPEDAPNIEQFPLANRVQNTSGGVFQIGNGNILQYEALADSGWYLLGIQAGRGDIQIPLDFSDNPPLISPMPMEIGEQWDISRSIVYGVESDSAWGEIFAALDSVYLTVELGGFARMDAWGTARYTGGTVPALRQHTHLGGSFAITGVTTLFGHRFEVPVYEQEMQASHTYRWYSPGIGEIATITSLPMEENENFNLASRVRVLRRCSALEFRQNVIAFGEVHIGAAGIAYLTIANSGEGAGIIDSVVFSGGLGAEIEALGQFPIIINPESVDSIRFLWMPTQDRDLENYYALVYHNDLNLQNPLEVKLTGHTPQAVDETGIIPRELRLEQNFPNPFNAVTTLRFALPVAGQVNLTVLDPTGREAANLVSGSFASGWHQVSFDAGALPSGVYQARLSAEGQALTVSMILVK